MKSTELETYKVLINFINPYNSVNNYIVSLISILGAEQILQKTKITVIYFKKLQIPNINK